MVRRWRLALSGFVFFYASAIFGAGSQAAISWVLYDNRVGFSEGATFSKKLFVGPESAFRLSPENYFSLDIKAPLIERWDSFEATLDLALSKVRGAKSPVLYLFVHSHGTCVSFERQYGKNIQFADWVDLIFSKIAKEKNPPVVSFLLSACESAGFFKVIQKTLADPNGAYTDGKAKYRYAVDVLVSSPENFFSYYNWFAEQIDELASLRRDEALGFTKKDWAAFTAAIGTETHYGWSSYESWETDLRKNLPGLMLMSAHHRAGQKDLGPRFRRNVADKTGELLQSLYRDRNEVFQALENLLQHENSKVAAEAEFYVQRFLEEEKLVQTTNEKR